MSTTKDIETTFKKLADLDSAGWDHHSAHTSVLMESHRGCEIRIVDDSGAGSFGYGYVIRAFCGDKIHDTTRTKSVSLTEEKNKANRIGCYTTAFAPGDKTKGIEMARKWIDAALEKPIAAA